MVGGNFPVPGIVPDRGHGVQIKALHIHQLAETAGPEHLHQVAGDTAQGKAAVDLLPEHNLLQRGGSRQGGAAGASLEGEAVLQQARRLDDLGGSVRHHQAHRVPGDPGGAGEDAFGVANGLHLDHVIYQVF